MQYIFHFKNVSGKKSGKKARAKALKHLSPNLRGKKHGRKANLAEENGQAGGDGLKKTTLADKFVDDVDDVGVSYFLNLKK